MNLFEVCILAVALAMDCFTVSIVSGVVQKGQPRPTLRIAFLFGFFQALMPLIGWLCISHFSQYLEQIDHWIAFGLLAFIGGRMVWDSFRPEEAEPAFDFSSLRTQLLLAVATSIDALAIGISFACTGYDHLSQLWLPLLIIGLVSFFFSILGDWLGTRFGHAIARKLQPERFGGIILILIGLRVLLTHLFG